MDRWIKLGAGRNCAQGPRHEGDRGADSTNVAGGRRDCLNRSLDRTERPSRVGGKGLCRPVIALVRPEQVKALV
jgi:hypothetical protein